MFRQGSEGGNCQNDAIAFQKKVLDILCIEFDADYCLLDNFALKSVPSKIFAQTL